VDGQSKTNIFWKVSDFYENFQGNELSQKSKRYFHFKSRRKYFLHMAELRFYSTEHLIVFSHDTYKRGHQPGVVAHNQGVEAHQPGHRPVVMTHIFINGSSAPKVKYL
jgi:hypothetical protein